MPTQVTPHRICPLNKSNPLVGRFLIKLPSTHLTASHLSKFASSIGVNELAFRETIAETDLREKQIWHKLANSQPTIQNIGWERNPIYRASLPAVQAHCLFCGKYHSTLIESLTDVSETASHSSDNPASLLRHSMKMKLLWVKLHTLRWCPDLDRCSLLRN